MTRSWAVGLVAGVVVALGLAIPSPAAAHARLLASTPEQGEVLEVLPDHVTLEFTEDVAEPAYIIVRSPAGALVTVGAPEVRGAVVTQRLADDGHQGTYSLAYRVMSRDGHPLTGEVLFSVGEVESPDPDVPASSAPPASTAEAGTTSASDRGSVARNGLDAGVAAALFLLALVLFGLSRRAET